MTNSELIKNYLTQNGMKDIGIKSLAEKIGVSHSAISRFVTKEGFRSYKELKHFYLNKQQLSKNALIYNDGNYVFSISKFLNNFDYRKLDFVASVILKKRKIILISKIFAEQIANYFYTLLRKINFNVQKYNSASEIDIITPEENAVFIFISFSGRNHDFKRILAKIKDKSTNSAFFLLTISKKSPLTPLMNETLTGYAYQENLDYFEAPIVPYVAMSIMVNMLYERLYNFSKDLHDVRIKK